MTASLESTLEQWYSHPGYAQWLARILQTKEGKMLMEILTNWAAPIADTREIMLISDPLAKMAMLHCLRSGQQITIDNIKRLSIPMEKPADLPGEWETSEQSTNTTDEPA